MMDIQTANDGMPLDYQDDSGIWWVMCACGHRVGGSPRPGDKIALCPNCRFVGSFGKESIPVIYPDRLPSDGKMSQEGDHPDHIARRVIIEEAEKKRAKRREAREKRLAKERAK